MAHSMFARTTTDILRSQGHLVRLSEGETPILDATIAGQEVVAFCYVQHFEICERMGGRCARYADKNFPLLCEEAAELMVAAANDMVTKRREKTAPAA